MQLDVLWRLPAPGPPSLQTTPLEALKLAVSEVSPAHTLKFVYPQYSHKMQIWGMSWVPNNYSGEQ